MSAKQILDREYLDVRSKILSLAASLDRLTRAEGDIESDARLALIREGLRILQQTGEDRAERVQLTFSREYDDAWRQKFGLIPVHKPK